MADKTKAVALNRQCVYEYRKTKPFDLTRAVAGGQTLNAPVITGTAPLARLRETTQKLGCLWCTALAHTPFPQIWGEMEQSAGCTAMQHTRHPDYGYQLLVSPERCCSSLRITRFSHAESVSSPSSAIAFSIASSIAGSTRNAICLLPLGIFVFDMCLTLGLILFVSCNVYHVSDRCKERSPDSARNTSGPLTSNVNRSNAMAKPQCNQTHPKFTWRFLALNRHDKKATPCRLSVEAATEREARRILAPHFILSLAARLPVQEVSHA